jgi:hypothetical protein
MLPLNWTSASRRIAGSVIALLLASGWVRAGDLDRADYKITLPEGATVDKPDDDIDADHMTTVNLPNGNAMIFIVVDDTQLVPDMLGKLTNKYKEKIKDAVVGKTDAFDQAKATKSVLVSGKLNGLRFSFAMGEFDRKQKALVVIFTYPQSEKAETTGIVRKALSTLTIKP